MQLVKNKYGSVLGLLRKRGITLHTTWGDSFIYSNLLQHCVKYTIVCRYLTKCCTRSEGMISCKTPRVGKVPPQARASACTNRSTGAYSFIPLRLGLSLSLDEPNGVPLVMFFIPSHPIWKIPEAASRHHLVVKSLLIILMLKNFLFSIRNTPYSI